MSLRVTEEFPDKTLIFFHLSRRKLNHVEVILRNVKPLLDCNTSIKLNLKIANISTSTLSWRNSLSILYLEEIETRQPYFGFGFKGLNMTGRKTKTRKQSFFRFWKWIVSEWCNWFFSCSVQPKTLSFKCVLIENGNKGFFEVKIRHKTLKSFACLFSEQG